MRCTERVLDRDLGSNHDSAPYLPCDLSQVTSPREVWFYRLSPGQSHLSHPPPVGPSNSAKTEMRAAQSSISYKDSWSFRHRILPVKKAKDPLSEKPPE